MRQMPLWLGLTRRCVGVTGKIAGGHLPAIDAEVVDRSFRSRKMASLPAATLTHAATMQGRLVTQMDQGTMHTGMATTQPSTAPKCPGTVSR
jgi:hypothetical protein